jgi:hypothetical protein
MKKAYKDFNNKTLRERLQRLWVNLFEYGAIWFILGYVFLVWLTIAVIVRMVGFSAFLQFFIFWR